MNNLYSVNETPTTERFPALRSTIRTLVVDDDILSKEMIIAALTQEGYEVEGVTDGRSAVKLMSRRHYDVLLADLFMPEMSGFDLLNYIQGNHPDVPVIIVTGFANSDLARRAIELGASDIVMKPCSIKELPIVLERNLARHSQVREKAMQHRTELQVSHEAILETLLAALDTRDAETEGHSERVTAYTMEIAEVMGVPSPDLYHIERGALLHDIGKIGIPDRILLKPGPLDESEWAEMKKHPTIGYRLCSRIEILQGAADVVLRHHERYDGKGYPGGISGKTIPLGARIFSVVDAFDAMTSDRPYRVGMDYEHAKQEIIRNSGTQFDPDVVNSFLKVPQIRWNQIRALSERMIQRSRIK